MSTNSAEQRHLLAREKECEGRDGCDRNNAAATEGSSWIVMTSLLVLGIGICLEVDFFVHRPNPDVVPSPIFLLDKLAYIEGFDIGCMAVAVMWIVFTLARYCCCHEKETPERVFIGNYLIYGLVFFALGGSFLEILQAVLFFSYPSASATGRVYVLSKIVFIIAQVIFIFSSRYRHIFTRTLFNGVFLFHIIVTNVILYLRTFVEGKLENVNEATTNTSSQNASCHANISHHDFCQAYKSTSKFLAPFCLEFALTSTALLAELWFHHGHETIDEGQSDYSNNNNAVGQSEPRQKEVLGSITSASVLGLFILGSLVCMFIYLYYAGEVNGKFVFRGYRLILVSLLIVICLIGLSTLHWNSRLNNSVGLDEFLVYFSLFGVFVINVLEINAATGIFYIHKNKVNSSQLVYIHKNNEVNLNSSQLAQLKVYAEISILDNILWCIQSALQAAFITKALHRAPRRIKLANTSSLAVILIFCNLCVWLMDTIDMEDTGDSDSIYSKSKFFQLPETMYGPLHWQLVKLVIYPILIFFRIHCVFTFYRVFNSHRTLG
ncbi:uncharacterized protein LOC134188340 [Corticium candelabrum]|uniref:uncharacterized protein LOC134188340 n=1 Tax=Corticium candelabrum TaxID=121492 RepID=UPI002E272B61|nr:uncharacterized protein LOC134188340 [Corticium candelabrum]